ncbi:MULTISPECIES: ester cyclase [Snodgrassella]|uniref:nuclear transport factor 2 family protein n=1 Tax=Snodgrassella TaxID=1193515 RepID=UPI0004D8C6C3|nr:MULTISPECIES: ester cyclase [unclassified Snodgrassella]KES10370.1 hypothetical protein SASC598O11_011220 [Snodgrassella alvi SCGC AB-598-O11]MBI0066788.1 ester cyclase [Snodgrassella sp. M0110]MBI0076293.1 ester cyclase [Snodgrassella sp. M0118]MBI0078089.1 ester cyclase [Snodgrassella sp. M0112]
MFVEFHRCCRSKRSKAKKYRSRRKNRTLVINFYNNFFNKHKLAEATKTLAEDYKQHNPYVANGRTPAITYFEDFLKQNPQSSAIIIRSSVEGDIVWLHVHSKINEDDLGKAVVDIFRVKDGKIVEHWDVIQNVPEQAENNNTMF